MNDGMANLHPTGPSGRRANDARRAAVMLAAGLLLGAAWPTAGHAAGSRAAVEAQPGEIVLLRAVPARHAARTMPPGRALMVNPSPEPELDSGLSQLEIANESYGRVAAGGQGSPGGVVGGSMSSFMAPLGVGTRGGDRTPAPSAAAGGAMGAATGSIASQVTGALAGAGLMGQGGSR